MKKENKVISGLIWSFAERITAQLVSTVVTIVLARFLDPEHYGIISIVTVFITLCNIFVSSGFGSAIIRKKNASDEDFNTAFWLSSIVAVFLYLILFYSSPYVAAFYEMNELTWVIRVMALRLPIAALNTIQQAYIRRQMEFKRFFVATLAGTIASGIVGIAMALAGFGVWALVAQYLTNTTVDTIVLCFVCGWNPKIQFSRQRAKEIFSFGWKVLATDLVANLEGDVRSLIVGKIFGSADLAFFDQGKKYPALLVNNVNSSINKVMLPAYSKYQDQKEELKAMLSRSIQIGMFILTPILIGFAAVSDTFVSVVLTEKWNASIPYIQIFCIIYMLRPLETSCHQAILAIGRSDIALKIMLLINTVAIASLLIATIIFKSVLLIAAGSLLATLISVCSFIWATNIHIGYSFKEQCKDIWPPVFMSALMGTGVYCIKFLPAHGLSLLIIQVLSGGIIYFALSCIFRCEAFMYLTHKLVNKER